MASVHTWSGLLPGWLLYVIFLFGTLAFFQQEISQWMRPELSSHGVTPAALDRASAYLRQAAPHAGKWTISLPPDRGGDPIVISWTPPEGSKATAGEATLDPRTGRKVAVRDTRGGWFLYRMHFDLHYMPWWVARYLVCIAALGMLVALVSGIVTHKKIFTDFFMLRFGKGQRSWLDAHNVTAVVALPFHLMMTYTGLVALLFTLMPWAITATFPTEEAFYEAAAPSPPVIAASGHPAELAPLSQLVARASVALDNSAPNYITVTNVGDANAVLEAWPGRDQLGSLRTPVYLNGATGEMLRPPAARGGAMATEATMIDLHTARFSRTTLRWLYFLSGLGGTAMVATGLVLWTVKRRAKLPDPARPPFGFRLVEKLNIGMVVGAPMGIAVYFLANRLLPPALANRADWEIHSLFITWGAGFIWAAGRPTRRAWVEVLIACAVLYALIPFVSALSTSRGLIPSLLARDWAFVGVDLAALVAAALFAFAASKVGGHAQENDVRRKAREWADNPA